LEKKSVPRIHALKKTLIEEAYQTLKEELDALRTWQKVPTIPEDTKEGILISITKIESTLRLLSDLNGWPRKRKK